MTKAEHLAQCQAILKEKEIPHRVVNGTLAVKGARNRKNAETALKEKGLTMDWKPGFRPDFKNPPKW